MTAIYSENTRVPEFLGISATAPTTCKDGDFYYCSTTDCIRTYNGSNWSPTSKWNTFSPTVTLVGGAGNTVPQYTNNLGRYCQLGKIAYVNVYLNGDTGDAGAGTGQINIALPVAGGANKIDGGTGETEVGVMTNGSGPNILFGGIAQSATKIVLERQSVIGSHPNLTGADQDNTARSIRLHFWYEVD